MHVCSHVRLRPSTSRSGVLHTFKHQASYSVFRVPCQPLTTSITISVARLTAALLRLVGVAAIAALAAPFIYFNSPVCNSAPTSTLFALVFLFVHSLHPLPSCSFSPSLLLTLTSSSRLNRHCLLNPPSWSNPWYFFLRSYDQLC